MADCLPSLIIATLVVGVASLVFQLYPWYVVVGAWAVIFGPILYGTLRRQRWR